MYRNLRIASYLLLALVHLGHAATKSSAQEKPYANESLLRSAYEKLSYFNQAANAEFAAQRHKEYKADDDLRFELRIMRAGPIKEIADRPIGELVTKPVGEVIQAGWHVRRNNQGPEHVMVEARWIVSGYAGSLLEDWEHTPIKEVLRLAGQSDATEYAAYEVTVHMADRQRTYQALALYRNTVQSGEAPEIIYLDNVVGQTALTNALLEKRPAVKAPWFEYVKSEEYRNYVEASKHANQRDHEPMLERLLNNPPAPDLPEPPPNSCTAYTTYGTPQGKYKVDYTYHTAIIAYGQHDVRTAMQGQCFYDDLCGVACSVSLTNLELNEYGIPSSACHRAGWNIAYEDGTGPINRMVNCSATVGAAFKACLFCDCSVSVKIGGVEVSSDGFWTVSQKLSHMCCGS